MFGVCTTSLCAVVHVAMGVLLLLARDRPNGGAVSRPQLLRLRLWRRKGRE